MGAHYALLWSGGKDGALALHRARRQGRDVKRLITFYDRDSRRVRFHGTRIEVLQAQAAAIGIQIHTLATTWDELEAALKTELDLLREEGFGGVVLGDIHLADVRAWYETRVTAAGLEHVEPLWGEAPADLLAEFVESGGRAVVTCIDLTRLDRSWLGRVIDEAFVSDIVMTGVDPCGENGEYHSFVFDGPMLSRPIDWRAGEVKVDERFCQLDVVAGADDPNSAFRDDVIASLQIDPRPTLENLARSTGLTYEDVAHQALVRYASSGAEALMAIEPHALARLIAARKAHDWETVAGIIDWLEAGL